MGCDADKRKTDRYYEYIPLADSNAVHDLTLITDKLASWLS